MEDPEGVDQGQGIPQVQIRFALTPSLEMDTVLDYSSHAGAKLFNMATASLETQFDMQANNIKLFKRSIRATTFG
jgi:hypothetical protein